MSNKPTIVDVARRAEVSISTVSRFMTGSAPVKKRTADRIASAIHELNYPYDLEIADNGSTMAPGNRAIAAEPVILINVPSVSNPFYNDLIRGVQASARAHGYIALLNVQHINASSKEAFFRLLRTSGFSGLVVMNSIDEETFDQLYETIPFVQCAECQEDQTKVSYVTIDDVSAAKKMTEHLYSTGHEKIAFLSGPSRYKYARNRKKGYLLAMKELGLRVDPAWIIESPDIDFNVASSAATALMSAQERPNAIFACSDVLAAAAIRACNTVGLSVPEDVVISGFDDIQTSLMTSPTITTVNQPTFQMGQLAGDLLLSQIKDPSVTPRQIILDTDVVIRESTQKNLL